MKKRMKKIGKLRGGFGELRGGSERRWGGFGEALGSFGKASPVFEEAWAKLSEALGRLLEPFFSSGLLFAPLYIKISKLPINRSCGLILII